MLDAADRTLSIIEDVCGWFAAAGLAAIMLIVASDVMLRYVFGRPWTWSYDFVGIYLTVATFYLALSRTMRERGHINVDLIHGVMSFRVRHAVDCFISVVSAALFAFLSFLFVRLTWSQYSTADVISSIIDWPVWASTVFVPIGTILIALRLIVQTVRHAEALRTGVEPPTPAGAHMAHGAITTGE